MKGYFYALGKIVLIFFFFTLLTLQFSYAETDKKALSSNSSAVEKNVCFQVLVELKKQNKMLSRDLGHIKRELIHLKYEISKPGFREIFGGIGYILGIFGIAAYLKARHMEKTNTNT